MGSRNQEFRLCSVMVITLVSDTSNPGSIPGTTFSFFFSFFFSFRFSFCNSFFFLSE